MKSYVARQPIFDEYRSVYGYELLYRDSNVNTYNPLMEGDRATRAVVSEAITTFGMNNLTNDQYAFINLTRSLLVSRFPYLLAPEDFIIEVLEDVVIDEELLEKLKALKEAGYTLALDDYIGENYSHELIQYIDIIKVDFKLISREQRAKIAKNPEFRGKKLLAEKVETEEEFLQAIMDGYHLFQGYFFAKPTIFSKSSAEISSSTYIRAIREIIKPSPDFEVLSQIIRMDVNLTYKLLYRVNTLEYYRRNRVKSIKQALLRLGLRETHRWILLIVMRDYTKSKSNELVKVALIRGVLSEKISVEIGLKLYNDEPFIVGMFSIIDSILEESLPNILKDVCVSKEVEDALLDSEQNKNNKLKSILNFVKAYEVGDWETVVKFSEEYHISTDIITNHYLDAIHYADIAFSDNLNPAVSKDMLLTSYLWNNEPK